MSHPWNVHPPVNIVKTLLKSTGEGPYVRAYDSGSDIRVGFTRGLGKG